MYAKRVSRLETLRPACHSDTPVFRRVPRDSEKMKGLV